MEASSFQSFVLSICPPVVSITSLKGKHTCVYAALGSFFSLLVKSWTCLSACQVLLCGSLSNFTPVRRIHWSHASVFSLRAHLFALTLVHLMVFFESQLGLIDLREKKKIKQMKLKFYLFIVCFIFMSICVGWATTQTQVHFVSFNLDFIWLKIAFNS